jgi:hypothetical protein
MKEEKTLITTYTGEPSQPVRIYYQVFKPKTVLGVFKKLRCVYFEQELKRWRWLYEHEAQKLRFETSYSKIPKEAKPIVIGEFFWRGETELLLEVRSFDRAIKALEFFERRINPRAAKPTKLRVVNRLFAASEPNIKELLESPYDRFFDGNEVDITKPFQVLKEAQAAEESQEETEDLQKALFQELENELKEKIPEVEEISLELSREDFQDWSGLQLALTLRTMEAQAHFVGQEDFSRYDLIEEVTQSLVEILNRKFPSELQISEEEE